MKGSSLNNFGRPVLITDRQWMGEGKPKQERTRKGTFHVWGYDRDGRVDGPPSMRTVAIVELENGRITKKDPNAITFLDREGATPQ